jgi:hypothetical protein
MIEGLPSFVMTWDVRPPIDENKQVKVRANSVTFKNAGEQTASLNKWWTLEPGESISIAVSESPVSLISNTFIIEFSGSGTKKVEWAELICSLPELVNYKDR